MNALERLIEETRAHDPVLAGRAALELSDLQAVLAELLGNTWREPVPGQDVYCRYCGRQAWRGQDIVHQQNCPVRRGREMKNR